MPGCLLLAACPVTPELRRYYTPGDWVVACDAGWHNAERLGLAPDLVVGDFDSSTQPDGEKTLVLPTHKDDTDTHCAARLALQHGCTRVTILGGLGGARLEHTLANLATGLWLARQGVDVLLADENSEVRYALPAQPLRLAAAGWRYFSLLPLDGPAQGVCVAGAAYPLQNVALLPDYPLGVSNEFAAETAEISLQSGALAAICTRADTPPRTK